MPQIAKQRLLYGFFTIVLILSVGQSGCNSRKKENLNPKAIADSQAQRVLPVPAKAFKIVLTRGGGFTALWHGYSLYADGRVESWRRFGAQADSIIWTVQADPLEIQKLGQELEKSGILGQEIQRWGNFSQSVSYVTSDTTRVWAWTDEDENQLPGEFKDWYNRIQEFCARQKNNQP